MFGRYEVRREIARGAMGVVSEAQDTVAGRRVALKTLRLPPGASPAVRARIEERFLFEARVAAGLSHPGIVAVLDSGRDDVTGDLFIAFEYVEGTTLAEAAVPGALPWAQALAIVRKVAEALEHAHAHGVVHRDLKPSNVLVRPDGEPKVLDFGIAALADAPLPGAPEERVGTALYLSPEQALGRPVDARSDLFSLGSLLYFLLTGRAPFVAPTLRAILLRVVREEPLPPSRFVPDLPADLDHVVRRAMAKNPAERYPDARTLAEDVRDVEEGRPPRHREGWAPPQAAQTNPFAPLAAPGRLRPRPAVVLAFLLAAAAAVGFAPWRGPGAGLVSAVPAPGADVVPVPAATPAPTPLPTPVPTPVPTPEPARLAFDFEHGLEEGRLRLWVDGELRLDETLESRSRRKAVAFKSRKGTLDEVLEMAPGQRELTLQVSWDDDTRTERRTVSFLPGESRRLSARLGGFLKKSLSMEWRYVGDRASR